MLGQIAFRNTIKNWRHSISALLSLSAAFVSLVLFDGYLANVKELFNDTFVKREMLGSVIIQNQDLFTKEGVAEPWKFWISKEEQEQLKKFFNEDSSKVANFVRSLQFQGIITNGQQSQILIGRGFDIESGTKMRGAGWAWNATRGKPLQLMDSKFVGLLGQGMARKMGCTWPLEKTTKTNYEGYESVERPFDCPSTDLQISTTTVDGQLNAVDVNIVGMMDAGYKDIDDRYMQTSLEAAQTLLNTEAVTFISVELQKGETAAMFIEKFDMAFKDKFPQLKATSWTDHRMGEMYKQMMAFLGIFRNFVVVVILVVSTLSVLNTMVKIVKERTREIGTLRSIGFSARQIVVMFFYESLYLSMMGIGLGIFFSIVLTTILNSLRILYKAGLLAEPVVFQINYDLIAYATAVGILVVVSTLACYFSTKQILKSKIVDNLNHV